MGSKTDELPDWERLLAAERHVQHLVPGATLVGGTAAAIHARHRVSMDGDHVLEDLRDRFDEILSTLESVAGWQTERIQKPVLILGQLDGILTGIRQLRRTKPLETEIVEGLRVPTLAEMARIKAWLLATRDTVRDYLDTVVLFERLGEDGTIALAVCVRSSPNTFATPPATEYAPSVTWSNPRSRTGAASLKRHWIW
jgi:hypothetical protein